MRYFDWSVLSGMPTSETGGGGSIFLKTYRLRIGRRWFHEGKLLLPKAKGRDAGQQKQWLSTLKPFQFGYMHCFAGRRTPRTTCKSRRDLRLPELAREIVWPIRKTCLVAARGSVAFFSFSAKNY